MISENFAVAAEELLALFELTPDLVCIADKPGYFRNFNAAVTHTLGYSREELLSNPISMFIHPDDRESTGNRRANLLNGETLLNFQNRYVTKSGETVWLEWTSMYIEEKDLVFAIAKNITERKLLEQKVEQEFNALRHKATQFKSSLERDRKYVASEMHEDLAQLATAVKVDLDRLRSNIPATPDTKSRLDHAFVTFNILVDTIRRISFSISPGMLDDLGLIPTLEWYCEEFSSLNGIDCSFDANFDENLLSKEVRLDFFRICQEVLNQVKSRAQHLRLKISIKQRKDLIVLTIDGIDGDDATSTGVVSVKERVDSFGGEIAIDKKRIIISTSIEK